MRYEASEGVEEFLSIEDPQNDILVGILRLRIPSQHAHRPEVAGGRKALIRELHVYGVPSLQERNQSAAWSGSTEVLGKKLLSRRRE